MHIIYSEQIHLPFSTLLFLTCLLFQTSSPIHGLILYNSPIHVVLPICAWVNDRHMEFLRHCIMGENQVFLHTQASVTSCAWTVQSLPHLWDFDWLFSLMYSENICVVNLIFLVALDIIVLKKKTESHRSHCHASTILKRDLTTFNCYIYIYFC